LSLSLAVPLLTTFLVVLVVPGQDFVTVARLAMSRSRRVGIAAASGTATGLLFWALASVLGVSALLDDHVGLSSALRIGGAVTLMAFGMYSIVQALRAGSTTALGASVGDRIGLNQSLVGAWATGLLSNLTNIKLLVFFSSIFSGFLPDNLSVPENALIALAMATIGFGWFSLVATLGSHPRVAQAYHRARRGMDVAFGLVFIAAGVLVALRH
jgi:threonine efflux protein